MVEHGFNIVFMIIMIYQTRSTLTYRAAVLEFHKECRSRLSGLENKLMILQDQIGVSVAAGAGAVMGAQLPAAATLPLSSPIDVPLRQRRREEIHHGNVDDYAGGDLADQTFGSFLNMLGDRVLQRVDNIESGLNLLADQEFDMDVLGAGKENSNLDDNDGEEDESKLGAVGGISIKKKEEEDEDGMFNVPLD